MGPGRNILRIHNAEFTISHCSRSLQNNNLENSATKEEPNPTTAPVEVLHTADVTEIIQGNFLRDFYLLRLSLGWSRGAGNLIKGVFGKE
jgi:hypothetical protein